MCRTPSELLLIEDRDEDVEFLLRAARKHGLEKNTRVLRDGAKGLDYLFAQGEFEGRDARNVPRAIVLNLKLPKVDGIEVLKRIRSDERTRAVPVVIYTSSQEERDIRACYELGANSYVVKPIGYEELVETLSDLIRYWMLRNVPPVGSRRGK